MPRGTLPTPYRRSQSRSGVVAIVAGHRGILYGTRLPLSTVARMGNAVQLRNELEPVDEQFQGWLAEGRTLADRHRRNLWEIGDWWARGEHAYGDRAKLAVELFGGSLSYGSLRNIGSVAGRVEPSQRRDDVPFWTHEIVASLEPSEQDKYLAKVAAEKLSRTKLFNLVHSVDRDVEASIRKTEQADRAEHREMSKAIKEAGFEGGWDYHDRWFIVMAPAFGSCDGEALQKFLESDDCKQLKEICRRWGPFFPE